MLQNSHSSWFALYTRSRCERVVLQQLRSRSLAALLPEYAGRDGGRRPLFPGYVFVQVTPAQKRLAVQIPFVVHMVHFAGEAAAIPEEQLHPYLLAEAMGVRLQPWPFLKSGDRVRVRSGPLQGVVGLFDRRRGGRLVLNVDLLAGSAAIEIAADVVEPVRSVFNTSRQGGRKAGPG